MSDPVQLHIRTAVLAAVERLFAELRTPLPADDPQALIALERPKDPSHGDFSCNIAMQLARHAKQAPRALAESLVSMLPPIEGVREVAIAGPGFINFHLVTDAQFGVLAKILQAGEAYGNGAAPSTPGAGRGIHIEFCSANPTGPLHVGHGRGAAYGMALANVLEAAGEQVHREYYVNDAGRQIDILAVSTWLRALEAAGNPVAFPEKAYQGDYILEMAAERPSLAMAVPDAPDPLPAEPEAELDAWIACARQTFGPSQWGEVTAWVAEQIRLGIEQDLADFSVRYDAWFSERSLFATGRVEEVVSRLKAGGHVYEADGALWFRSTAFGDEKDRVVIRDNGIPTYFASDIAYHFDKFQRGFDHVIDIWGADHHGYIARIHGALAALGIASEKVEVLLVQFATLVRGGEKVQMSTRSGQFVELAELVREVGCDAARYFYVTRRCEQHLEFDLALAKAESRDNPVYYIQYAHARIAAVRRTLETQGATHRPEAADVSRLSEPRELALVKTLGRFPEVIQNAARKREPHQVANYLSELANEFHGYYNDTRILVDDTALRDARVMLLCAIQIVLARGLDLLGVSAPERM